MDREILVENRRKIIVDVLFKALGKKEGLMDEELKKDAQKDYESKVLVEM